MNLRTAKRRRKAKPSFKLKKINISSGRINSSKISTNDSMVSTDLESQRIENFYLSEINSESKLEEKLISNISKNIMGRIDKDKRNYDNFLEDRNLTRYRQIFADIGCTSLGDLSNMTVVDFNNLYIPAGHQIKIKRGLVKLGYAADDEKKKTASAGVGTEVVEVEKKKQKTGRNYVNGKLNFGIKVKKKNKISVEKEGRKKVKIMKDSGTGMSKPGMSNFMADTDDLPPLQPHELNVNREMPKKSKTKGILKKAKEKNSKRFKSAILQTENDDDRQNTSKKNLGRVKFNLEKNTHQPIKVNNFLNKIDEENIQQGSRSNFSFSNFGGFNWVNSLAKTNENKEGNEEIDLSHMKENIVLYPSRFNPEASLKKEKICCYNCLTFLVKTQASTHPKIPDKVRNSIKISKVFLH